MNIVHVMVNEIKEIHNCMRKSNERFAMRMHPDDMVDLVDELKKINKLGFSKLIHFDFRQNKVYEDEHPPITKIYLLGVRIFADLEAPRVES